MNHTITTGIGVVVGLFAIAWAFSRFGKLGGVIVVILVVVIGGSFVGPIKTTATGIIDVLQAPLNAADQLIHKNWR